MQKKYQVFISSTYEDLQEERLAVMHCLLDNGCIPVGMEQFPASGMSQMEYIKKMLDECDCYLLILAGRYGSLDEDDTSFTEKEYDYAVSLGIPILSFVYRDIGKLPSEKCEETQTARNKLEKFKKKVCSGRLVKFYLTIGDLKSEVATSINKCINDIPMRGWIRGPLDEDEALISKKEATKLIENFFEKRTATKEEIDEMLGEVFSK